MDDQLRDALDTPHYYEACPARALCQSHSNDEIYHRCPQCGQLTVEYYDLSDYGYCTECKEDVLWIPDDPDDPPVILHG